MSLINDALRKARQKAIDQGERDDGPDVFALRVTEYGLSFISADRRHGANERKHDQHHGETGQVHASR